MTPLQKAQENAEHLEREIIKEFMAPTEAYHDIERVLNDFKNGATYSDSIDRIQSIIALARAETLEEVREKIKPTEIAERIVIEYANISGRESKYRGFVREATHKVLTDLLAALESTQNGDKTTQKP